MKRRKVCLQHDIEDTGYPTNSLGYFSGHFMASLNELERHGTKRFDKLTQEINKNIPDGELAGSHGHGAVKVSSRIPHRPKWLRKEIIEHEYDEEYYMGR